MLEGGNCKGSELQGSSRTPAFPFSRLAFDLVGPLPRTKQGHQYLLTRMCLGRKAVTLKRVDAHSVAEGMCEIFSRIVSLMSC